MKGVTARRLPLLAILAAAMLAAAFHVSPATAAGTTRQTSWLCNSATYSSFSSLTKLGSTGVVAGRGSQLREPADDQTLDSGQSTRAYDPNFTANVPVWVHVVSPDGTIGWVSQALIDDQIVVLNNTFGGGEGGVDTGFHFTLAGVTHTVNADWFYANPGGKERAMKRGLYVPGDNVLNMYLTTAGDYLGWA
jgi:hypothetical protein